MVELQLLESTTAHVKLVLNGVSADHIPAGGPVIWIGDAEHEIVAGNEPKSVHPLNAIWNEPMIAGKLA